MNENRSLLSLLITSDMSTQLNQDSFSLYIYSIFPACLLWLVTTWFISKIILYSCSCFIHFELLLKWIKELDTTKLRRNGLQNMIRFFSKLLVELNNNDVWKLLQIMVQCYLAHSLYKYNIKIWNNGSLYFYVHDNLIVDLY